MRWADSDSSDDEEDYVPPSSEPEPEPEIVPQDPREERRSSFAKTQYQNDRRGSQQQDNRGGRQSHQSNFNNNRGRQNPNNRGGNQPRGGDWKQMAKASSRFSDGAVDGSSWMAKRRAKQEEEEKEFKARREEMKIIKEKETREKRQSQVDALKNALGQIKVSDSTPSASSTSSKKDTIKKYSPPKQILKKTSKESPKPMSPTKILSKPPTHSYTIGPPAHDTLPKGELQPNGTVKFSRKNSKAKSGASESESSSKPPTQPRYIQVGPVPASYHDDDDVSMASKGSRASMSSRTSKGSKSRGGKNRNRNRNRRRGGGGGRSVDANDESSVTSHRSRGSRGGGRGGGRGRGRGGRGGRGRGGRNNREGGRGGEGGSGQVDQGRGGSNKDKSKGRGGGRGSKGSEKKASNSPTRATQHSYEIGKD